MAISLVQFQASSQHLWQNHEQLRVNGHGLSREQLRLALEPNLNLEPIQHWANQLPVNEDPAAVVPNLDNADASSRLRRLILQAFLGRHYDLQQTEVMQSAELQSSFVVETGAIQVQALTTELNGAYVSLVRREHEASWVHMAVALGIDGKVIEGQLDIRQSRAQTETLSLDGVSLRKMIDPLVLNFGGPVQLSSERVRFDLNADGEMDSIAGIASASYLLARDVNGNGVIDSGSEVFGALTGDGYAELQGFDDSGDQLISPEDTVWQTLTLWRPGDAGVGPSLDAAKIQAIGLQSIESPFLLTDSGGESLGQVRKTGFFLVDSQLQTSQQIDFFI